MSAQQQQENTGDSVKALIEELGGIRPFAKKSKFSSGTVNSWVIRESIPVKHWPIIISVAAEDGVSVTYERLIQLSNQPKQGSGSCQASAKAET